MSQPPTADRAASPHVVRLRCGTLRLWVDQADWDLGELCGYACRRSRKRGFVFLSKVLGKHYPVRPRRLAAVCDRLAAHLQDVPGPVLVIGLAETATALGQGVYEHWLRRRGRRDGLFLHTTRYPLRLPPALVFEESHSHATRHLLYGPPDPGHALLFRRARALVLVDDEVSTGATLANLAAAYRERNRFLKRVHVVSITDWLSAARREEVGRQVGLPVTFHSLLRGRYNLEADEAFDPGPVPDVTGRGECKDRYLPQDSGRLGQCGRVEIDSDALLKGTGIRRGERLLVLGTGEFSYSPFLLARELEARGWEVFFQATTRSPLLLGEDITSALEFVDNYHDGIANYLYNVSDRHYDRILIGYETCPLPAGHRLPELLGGVPVFF
jgi:hypothetical protein